MSTLDALVERTASSGTRVVSVACAADSGVLEAVEMAIMKGIASFLLVDDEERLQLMIKIISLSWRHTPTLLLYMLTVGKMQLRNQFAPFQAERHMY